MEAINLLMVMDGGSWSMKSHYRQVAQHNKKMHSIGE